MTQDLQALTKEKHRFEQTLENYVKSSFFSQCIGLIKNCLKIDFCENVKKSQS